MCFGQEYCLNFIICFPKLRVQEKQAIKSLTCQGNIALLFIVLFKLISDPPKAHFRRKDIISQILCILLILQ